MSAREWGIPLDGGSAGLLRVYADPGIAIVHALVSCSRQVKAKHKKGPDENCQNLLIFCLTLLPTLLVQSDKNTDEEYQNDQSERNPQRRKNPPPRPSDFSEEFEDDEYDCQKTGESNAATA